MRGPLENPWPRQFLVQIFLYSPLRRPRTIGARTMMRSPAQWSAMTWLHDLLGGLLGDLMAADRTVRDADRGIEQAKVIVDLG